MILPLNGVLGCLTVVRSQFFGQNTAYSTVCAPGYLQRRDEGLRDRKTRSNRRKHQNPSNDGLEFF